MSKDKKKPDTRPAAGAETSAEEAADLDAVMRKYDRESATRMWEGTPQLLIRILMAVFGVFCIGMTLFSKDMPEIRLTLFVGCIVIIGFLTYPASKHHVRVNYLPWYDIVLMVVGAFCFFYFALNAMTLVRLSTRIETVHVVIGVVGILILMELCRRCVGIPILCVVGVLLVYTFSTVKAGKVIYDLFYASTGVMNTPINVCAKFIVVFIIFGAFLERTGISAFFIDLANSLCGSSAGGPAKVAVISSALCGMVSGSSVGNTVTTGSVTIPMMKKCGYKPEFAGAVEAAASTGGQIMPPIMGAAAFLMAEYCDVPYSAIVVRAILPAFLYFGGIFLMVHFRAKRLGLKGLPREELPKFKNLVKKIYLLIPLVALVYMIITGYTMAFSAIVATVLSIAVSMINKEHRMTPSRFVDALENGGKNTLSVAVACAMAGIIAGVVTMTGLGQIFITAIVGVAGNTLIIALFLTMLCCILLGMGVPTTANYVIMATTCAPILINGMGMNVIAANMFVFYFGIVADITPPVALAAYAGAAIAKSNPMKTAFNASRLAIAAFIVPYIFAFNNAMLFIDTNVFEVAQVCLTSCIGMFGIAAGIEGYMLKEMNPVQRILSVLGGLMLIYPGTITDVCGVLVVVLVGVWQQLQKRKAAAV